MKEKVIEVLFLNDHGTYNKGNKTYMAVSTAHAVASKGVLTFDGFDSKDSIEDRIAKIATIETVEAVNAFVYSEKSKKVIKAATDRIAELEKTA